MPMIIYFDSNGVTNKGDAALTLPSWSYARLLHLISHFRPILPRIYKVLQILPTFCVLRTQAFPGLGESGDMI